MAAAAARGLKSSSARGGFVVIAADENFAQTAGAVDDFIGACAVTHDVAEIGNQIVRGSCRQAGFQGFEVGVNVAEKKYAQ